jgi:hypothetical protein
MITKGHTRDGEPICDWPKIHKECAKLESFSVEVTDSNDISIQQMKYLHAVVFPRVAEAGKVSLWQAEFDCKRFAGRQWLIKTIQGNHFILSKTSLTVKQTNEWIDNIRDWAEQVYQIIIPLPNKDWRNV